MKSRLTFNDSIALGAGNRAPGAGNDILLLWAFGGKVAPSASAVKAQIAERLSLMSAVSCVLVRMPRNIDYPYWVAAPDSLDRNVIHVESDVMFWANIESDMGEIATSQQLDPAEGTWRLRIFHRVEGVPRCSGLATVVLLQISHAVVTGASTAELSMALFGAEPRTLEIAGLAPARHRRLRLWNAPIVAGSAARRMISHGLMTLRPGMTRRPASDALPATVAFTPINVTHEGQRCTRIVPFSDADVHLAGYSRTVVAAIAISRAVERLIERYPDRPMPAQLIFELPVYLREAEFMGVNRQDFVRVDLRIDLADLRDRAEAVAAALSKSVAVARSPENLRFLKVVASQSWPIYQVYYWKAKNSRPDLQSGVPAHTSLSSIPVPGGPYTLADQPLRFVSLQSHVGPPWALSHLALGTTDSFAVTVASTGGIDLDLYEQLLRAAFAEVREQLR